MRPRLTATPLLLLLAACADLPTASLSPDAPAALLSAAENAEVLVWVDQFGTAAIDRAQAVAVHGGAVFVTGQTSGSLDGPGAGDRDAFVRGYSTDGALLWAGQFGTSVGDDGRAIAAGPSGVYVAGATSGDLHGAGAGGMDAFLRRYDAAGGMLWARQFGTSGDDVASGVAVGAGGVYVAGTTTGVLGGSSSGARDGYVRRYDTDGIEIWTVQFDIVSGSLGMRIAVDESGVYVADGGGPFASRLWKFDPGGTLLWTAEIMDEHDDVHVGGISVHGDGVYVGGEVVERQLFVAKWSTGGTHQWTESFGTGHDESLAGVATDESGVYLTGASEIGTHDEIFIRKYAHTGGWISERVFGSAVNDQVAGIAVDGGVYVAGWTAGDLEGTGAGLHDAYVARARGGSPAGQLTDLEADVGDLFTAGTLNEGQSRSLAAKLSAARDRLEAGDVEGAIRMLRAFINEVEAMVRGGILTEAEGRAMIDAASALIAELEA